MTRIGLLIAFGFLLCACARSDQTTLKIHHFVSATSTIHKDVVVPWCESIENGSHGELKCRICRAMQLGGSPTQVRDSVVDVVFVATGFCAGRYSTIEAFGLPFMMKDAQASSKALWDYVVQDDGGEFSDVHPLAFNVHGPGLFRTGGKALNTSAELHGLKIRATTRQASKLVTAPGATPIGIPLPQIPGALSENVIDGLMVPWEIVPTIKVDELAHFHRDIDRTQSAI